MKHICPACNGMPAKPAVAFINTGEDWSRHYAAEITLPCRVCENSGLVTNAVRDRWYAGANHMAQRVAKGETLFEAATRIGVTSAQLSAFERGYADLPAPSDD